MDFIAKKYSIIIENESIDFWVKNGDITKSEFMGKKVDFSLPRAVLNDLDSRPVRIIKGAEFAGNDQVKKGISLLFNRQLETAIAKGDKERLNRFSYSNLIPETKIDAVEEAKQRKNLAKRIVNKAKNTFNKVAIGVSKTIDKALEFDHLKEEIEKLKAELALKNSTTKSISMNEQIDNLLGTDVKNKVEQIETIEKEFEEQKPPLKERVEEAKAISEELKQENFHDLTKEELIERLTDMMGNKNLEKMKNEENEIDTAKLDSFIITTEEIIKKEESVIKVSNSQVKLKYTQQELDAFKRETTAEMRATDPKPVLDRLGIDYKEIGHDSYQMNLRGEKTPSAYITLKNGTWNYKDFGSSKGGSIVNVVMDQTGHSFKDAMSFTLDNLGVEDRLATALNSKEKPKSSIEPIKHKQEENKHREASIQVSRVTNTYDVTTNEKAVDYLKSRGIEIIPPAFKIISGEFTKQDGTIGKAYGVGVQTFGETGADIHFLNKDNDTNKMKTMTFGKKDLSFYQNEYSDKAVIFESKMDYAAAFQQDQKLHDDNVIIANGVAQAKKIGELLIENKINDVAFYNQNDKAGYQFIKDVAQTSSLQTFATLKYELFNEFKQDVNDLLLKGDSRIIERFTASTIDDISKNISIFENHENLQNQIKNQENHEPVQEQTQTKSQSHSYSR